MNKDTFQKRSSVQKFLDTGMEIGLRAHGSASDIFDFEPANRFIEEQERKKGERYSYTHLLVKASALAIKDNPVMNYQMVGNRIVHPSTIDIGVMVAADRNYAPIVVIDQADGKSLPEIAEELRMKTAGVRNELEAMLKKLRLVSTLLPFRFLRHAAVKRLNRNWKLRKRLGGTFQISNPGMFGIETMVTYNIATTCIVLVGSVKKRPYIIDNDVVARLCANLTFSVDHRVIDARQGISFVNSFKHYFEHPDTLYGAPEG